MAKALKYKTTEVVTLDNDGDEHESTVTYAVADEDTAGQEVLKRNGDAHVLQKGDVVVPAGAGKSDVFSAKEWRDMWADNDRVASTGDIKITDVAKKATSSGPRS